MHLLLYLSFFHSRNQSSQVASFLPFRRKVRAAMSKDADTYDNRFKILLTGDRYHCLLAPVPSRLAMASARGVPSCSSGHVLFLKRGLLKLRWRTRARTTRLQTYADVRADGHPWGRRALLRALAHASPRVTQARCCTQARCNTVPHKYSGMRPQSCARLLACARAAWEASRGACAYALCHRLLMPRRFASSHPAG